MRATVLLINLDEEYRQALSEALLAARFTNKVLNGRTPASDELLAAKPDLVIASLPEDKTTWPASLAVAEDLLGKSVSIIVLSANSLPFDEMAAVFEACKPSLILNKAVPVPVVVDLAMAEFAKIMVRRKDETRRKLEEFLSSDQSLTASRVEALREAVESVKSGSKAGALAEAITLAHQIKGTAATFGFERVGLLAGEIEARLVEARASGSPPDWNEIDGQIRIAVQLSWGGKEPEKPSGKAASMSRSGQHRVAKAVTSASGAKTYLARVLLLDDDEAFCKYVKQIGQQRLVEVYTARDPDEAFALLADNVFDGMIIDLNLGDGVDSCSVANFIRSKESLAKLPLAFISASGTPEERLRATQAGAVLFIDKPLEPENFEGAVHQLLTLSRESRSKVLLIEDDVAFADLVIEMLVRHGLEAEHAADGKDIFKLLDRVSPDLLLLDVQLPGFTGFELCTLLRSNPEWQSLPVIFVTAELGWQARVESFRCGADDYISKPLVEEELLAKIQARLDRAKLLQERTTRDTITGVLVRSAFIQQLHTMFKRSKSGNDSPISITIMDLDNFKKVNDLGGHLIGDSVLASLGRTLLNSFRQSDLRGRWGGDEFLIAFENTNKEQAAQLVRTMMEVFSKIEFHGEAGQPFHLSFSAGVAEYPLEGRSAYDLIKLADERLYKSKAEGRARVSIQ